MEVTATSYKKGIQKHTAVSGIRRDLLEGKLEISKKMNKNKKERKKERKKEKKNTGAL